MNELPDMDTDIIQPASPTLCDNVTVALFTSVIPRHPDTAIIDETIASVRFWFPTARIIILADGIRPEFESRRAQYEEYLWRLGSSIDSLTRIVRFEQHTHQASMLKSQLADISTPLLLFQEHDLPMMTDRPIDWQTIADNILEGRCNLVRLMLMEEVHQLHRYLYHGMIEGSPLERNTQYSGWTHLAATDLYRDLLSVFDPRARMTVERYVVRLVDSKPWERYKMTSYIPDPTAAKRIRHTDGRADPTRDNGNGRDPSFEEQEIYPPR